jgi:hypothetical protein
MGKKHDGLQFISRLTARREKAPHTANPALPIKLPQNESPYVPKPLSKSRRFRRNPSPRSPANSSLVIGETDRSFCYDLQRNPLSALAALCHSNQVRLATHR